MFVYFWRRFEILIRYYGVGLVNAGVGYGLYAAFVALMKNIYAAQLTAHIIGMTFNYMMFRAHVFRGAVPSVPRYIAAYAVNYLLGLTFLYAFHRVVPSPYLAGFLSLVAVSVINYFVLRKFVFLQPAAQPPDPE